MSGVLRKIGQVASVVATVAAFIPGAQPIALAASAVAATASVGAALTAKKPTNQRQGSQLQFKADPSAPIPLVMGRTAVGGNIVYRDTTGKDNHYQIMTSILSISTGSTGIGGVEGFTADRTLVPFTGTAAAGYYRTWMWQENQLGAAPSGVLRGGSPIGTPPGWTNDHRLSGYAASTWTLLFDTKARRYAQGEPQPSWILHGVKVYDPRLDSTFPGGSGPCRWADPANTAAHTAARATWVYSDSPALLGLMWRLGVWARDETNPAARYQKVMGIGAPIDLIDLPAIVHAANVQAANGWTIGGQIDSSQDRWEVLKLIDETGGAEPIANGALMSTLVKAPRVSLRTITGADLAGGRLSAPGMRARSERINGYRARFRSELHGWEIVPIDIVQVPAYVAEDGRAKTGSGDFSYCQNPDQCAELAAYEVFDSREIAPIVLPLKPFAVGYRLGDCLTIDLPELGLEGRDVIVRGRRVDPPTGIVTLTLRTETAGKHAAALGLTGETPASPTLTAAPDVIEAPLPDSWTLGVPAADVGYVTPTLLVTGAVDNANADAVLIEYRVHQNGQAIDAGWQGGGVEAPTITAKELSGLLRLTAYEVSVRYRGRGILSDRLLLGPVTALDVSISGPAGLNNAAVTIYQRSASGAPALPTAIATYTFATGAVAGLNNGWVANVAPPGTDPVYASASTASSTGATDTIAPNEWAEVREYVRNGATGATGLNRQSLFIYQRSPTAPALPSANATYTFSTATLTGLNNGWGATIPPANGHPLWVGTATAFSPTDIDNINPTEWAAAQILAQDGQSAYAIINNNESHTVAADAFGNVTDYGNASFTVTIFYGSLDVTSQFQLTSVINPQAVSGPAAYPTFGVTGGFDAGEDTASVTYNFVGKAGTIHAGIPLSTVFSLSKSKAGSNGSGGAAAALVKVVATPQAIQYNKDDTIVSGDVVFDASLINAMGPVSWSSTAGHGIFPRGDMIVEAFRLTLKQSRVDEILRYNEAIGLGKKETIIASASGTSDRVTITKIKDGQDGQNGKDGNGLIVSPPAFVIPSYAGVGAGSKPEWTGGAALITLNRGGTAIAADSYSYLDVENVSSIALSGRTITFSDVLGEAGRFTARATLNGINYDQEVRITRARDGAAAFSSSTTFTGSTGSGQGTANTTVPGGRSVRLSGAASYDARPNQSGRGSIGLYWRNATDNGAFQFIGSWNGSIASNINRGSVSEPDYETISGSVSGSATFTSPGPPDRLIEYRIIFGGVTPNTIGNNSGSIRLEVL